MAFIDGGGGTTFLPFETLYAAGAVGPWVALPIEPLTGDRPAALHPTLRTVISAATPPASVQFDLATDSGFTSMVWTVTDTAVPTGPWNHLVTPALTDLTKYWWRVRAGDGAGVWGPWATNSFTIDVSAGRGYQEIFLNVGIDPTLLEDYAGAFVYQNNGVTLGSKMLGIEYFWGNGTFQDLRVKEAWDYLYLGEVNTDTPIPHIWFLKPNAGRTGDGIQIVCFGAGDLQSTFDGLIEIYKGISAGWESVPINTWQVFPPTANAYTGSRTLDKESFVIDMQHQIIEVTVPSGSIPPGYPLRIRTNG